MVSEAQWPAVGYETHQWRRDPAGPRPSRRQLRAHSGPYEAAVLSSIAELTLQLPAHLAADVTEASAAITRFDAEYGDAVVPFSSLLLRTESSASSQIENLTASARAVLEAEIGSRSRGNASLVVANTRAMQAALALADRLDEQAILDMHAELLGSTRPEWTGRWRDQQVWIGGSPWGPHTALFVPPHHEHVAAAMRDLVSFMERDDITPFTQAAIAHAQFETVHPFPDGNGRVGRALVHAILRSKDVTRGVTVPISAGLLRERDAYFAALGSYRSGDPLPIVERFVDATFHALHSGRSLIDDLREVRDAWQQAITVRSDAAAWRLADLLLRQPVLDSRIVRERLEVSAPTAHSAIGHLVDVGILREASGQKRDRIWRAIDVLEALDAFAERSRRG